MAQIEKCKQNNRPLPNDVVSEAKRIRSNIELTKNYLKTGGRNAAKGKSYIQIYILIFISLFIMLYRWLKKHSILLR